MNSTTKSASIEKSIYQVIDQAQFCHLRLCSGEIIDHVQGFLINPINQENNRFVVFTQKDSGFLKQLNPGSQSEISFVHSGKYYLNEDAQKKAPVYFIESVKKVNHNPSAIESQLGFDRIIGNRLQPGLDFTGQKVVVRVDFNVPLDEQFNVTDPTRILAAKPTIDFILQNGGSCVLVSHLGRPKGKESRYSLKHIVSKVSESLQKPIKFHEDCIGSKAVSTAQDLEKGEILMMENLRFYKEETSGDKEFARELAKLGSIYVNDAFGTAHRAHASTTVMAQYFGRKKYFGKLLESELLATEKVIKTGKPPVVVILGGAKVSTKIPILESMMQIADHIIVGGGMVYTFKKALGGKIGNSICEDKYLDYCLKVLQKAKKLGVEIHLPIDTLAGDSFSNDANRKEFPSDQIGEQFEGMDSGPQTLEYFISIINKCQTILWNGPIGVFEFPNFAQGTMRIGQAIGQRTRQGAFSLVGGGDSVSAVKQFNLAQQMSYVSTGGGAMLESLEGKTLPGIKALLE